MEEQRRALENEFFREAEGGPRERPPDADETAAQKGALAEASGITDDALLSRLLELGITAATVAPLALVPLLAVAWADGRMAEKEKAAILAAAQAEGLSEGSTAHRLLESWLQSPPEPTLRVAWEQYTMALCGRLDRQQRAALATQILGRARKVAEAAGGFLGFGSKISEEEEAALENLARILEGC
jgi:uncharacterized tellurite resistance protein B-like protein